MKEFYELTGLDTTNQDWINNGFRVISFGRAKSEIMNILQDRETAIEYHLYNKYKDDNPKIEALIDKLEMIVFKESRGGVCKAIGWENGNSYLDYHSGIIYKWFKL